jgi:hypothetical protein
MNDNSSREWSDFELNILKKLKDKTAKEIHEIIKNRSIGAIRSKKSQIFGSQINNSEWTDEEDEVIKKFGDTLSVKELTKKIPDKSFYRISDRRLKLLGNISNYVGDWSEKEIKILSKCKSLKFSKIKVLFPNRNLLQLRRKMEALFGRREDKYQWSQDEIKILINNQKLKNIDLLKLLPNKNIKLIIAARKKYVTLDYNIWTKEEIENLKKLSIQFKLSTILRKIKNRTASSIKSQYYKLNLKFLKNELEMGEDLLQGMYGPGRNAT